MVQILPEVPSFGKQFAQNFAAGAAKGLDFATQMAVEKYKTDQRQKLIGDIENGSSSAQNMSQKMAPEELEQKFLQALPDIEKHLGRELTSKDLDQLWSKTQEIHGIEQKAQQKEEVPFLRAKKAIAANQPELARVYTAEEETARKGTESARKETLDTRKQYADKGKYATKAIENKKFSLELLKRGKIDDPLVVGIANYLPGAVQGKLLSSDTQLYKAGLFEEFGVLKNMFPGQIRVKEIELLEDKLASLEKSHEAKAKILENGMKKLEADKIYAKAAREVENRYPNARVLEFDELVEEKARPQLNKLYDEIVKQYDKIYFEYAPAKSSYVDQNGQEYRNVPKAELNKLFDEAGKEGLELKVI